MKATPLQQLILKLIDKKDEYPYDDGVRRGLALAIVNARELLKEEKQVIEYAIRAIEEHSNQKEEQKQALIDMMKADEKLGLYEKPQPTEDARRLKSIEVKIDTLMYDLMTIIERTESKDCAEPTDQQTTEKIYTIEDIERCVENWGLCKVEREYIEKFLETNQNKEDE